MSQKQDKIIIRNAKIGFRNFSGKEGKFNPPGRRNFVVFLENDLAEILREDGWNIKWLEARFEDEEPQPYLQVAVNYSKYPPKIVIVASQVKTLLSEANVGELDWVEIEKVDLIVRPYNWEIKSDNKKGVKAYLQSMYVTIVEDEISREYSDIPFAGDFSSGAPDIIEDE